MPLPEDRSFAEAVSSGKAVTQSKGKAKAVTQSKGKAVRGDDTADPISEEAVIVGEYSTSEDVSDYKPPYKVLFPGQRRIYASGGSLSRELKDPRLGAAIAYKKHLEVSFAGTDTNLNFNVSEEDTESEDEGEVIDLTIGKEIPILPFHEAEARGIDESMIEKPKWDIDRYWRKRLKEWDENEVMNLKVRDCLCVEHAMAFYNNKHDTDYEIVESLGSYRILVLGFWYHCNFRAQRKSDTLGGCHASPKLFFAEIYGAEVCNNNTVVTYCDIVDDRKHHVLV